MNKKLEIFVAAVKDCADNYGKPNPDGAKKLFISMGLRTAQDLTAFAAIYAVALSYVNTYGSEQMPSEHAAVEAKL